MTQDEIIELAKSINEDWWLDDIDLQAFAKLVAEKEREACAKIADEWVAAYPHPSRTIAEWIRKKGQA
tara:strand:- start:698 stop:901 length:204 start_codon:yes stop_codon:yes gene_type:complete